MNSNFCSYELSEFIQGKSVEYDKYLSKSYNYPDIINYANFI